MRLADFCSGAGTRGPLSVRAGGMIAACRHTDAKACAEHVVWSEMFCVAKRNRARDIGLAALLL